MFISNSSMLSREFPACEARKTWHTTLHNIFSSTLYRHSIILNKACTDALTVLHNKQLHHVVKLFLPEVVTPKFIFSSLLVSPEDHNDVGEKRSVRMCKQCKDEAHVRRIALRNSSCGTLYLIFKVHIIEKEP